MHPILRTIRTIVPPVLVGLQALMLTSCEPVQPLLVQQPSFSPDSLRPSAYVSVYGVHYITITTPDSSLTTGQQVQATGIPRLYSGDPVMQAPVTWSISPTNVATISATGLITGGSTSGTATVSATADGVTRSMTITVTATATKPSAPVHMISISINATQIKIGQVTQVSGVVRDIQGTPIANVPITWSTSPTTVATATTNSATTGTITGKGVGTATVYAKADTVTRQVTITVIDSATTSASGTPAPVPPGASGASYAGATAAELPRLSVNTTYPGMSRQVRIPAGANLQAAINNAQPGDELLLAPGATYVGEFTLPNKGANMPWIVIRTDVSDAAIGSPGTRMTPTRAASANLAKIKGNSMFGSMSTAIGANHYRFTGVEFGSISSVTDVNAVVRFGDNTSAQNSAATTANNLILDRVYIHGSSTQQIKRCVMLNSGTAAVVDSWLGDCHSNVSDSQAIVGWNGPGPFLIQNNHLEAGHEVIMFGGGGMTTQNASPSDITVRGNHITRPPSWKGVWQEKNIIESKHSRRLLIEGNVIENEWADSQTGFAIVLKSENQTGDTPWTQTTDVTIRYNKIRNVGSVFNLAGNPSGVTAIPAARIVITDNVVENVNVGVFTAEGRLFQLLPGLSDVVVKHNTMVSATGGTSSTVVFGSPAISRLVMHSNVLAHGAYGVKGDGTTEGSTSLAKYAPGYLFTNNAVVGGGIPTGYPANNYFPAQLSNLSFVNLAGGDYRLTSTSTYLNKGYDGRDIGADINTVNARTSNVVVGP
jgi:hypothetical protein